MKDEAYLYSRMPRFPWRRPVTVARIAKSDPRVKSGQVRERTLYGCRICYGLGRTEAKFDTMAAHAEHVDECHPDAPGAELERVNA